MSKKKYDVVAAVGKYTDQSGQEKTRWQTVGAVLQTDKGHCLLLEKWFNPAGLAEPDRPSVILSLFEPNNDSQPRRSAPPADDGFGDDIPFNQEAA